MASALQADKAQRITTNRGSTSNAVPSGGGVGVGSTPGDPNASFKPGL